MRALITTPLLTCLSVCCGWAVASATPVEQIDWKNRTYQHRDAGAVEVKGGVWEIAPNEEEEENYPQSLTINKVMFADLTGSGAKEAIILSQYWGGGTEQLDQLKIYRATAKGVELFARIPGGDRGDGGIAMASVEGRVVKVTRMGALNIDGACCPSLELDERWSWREGAMRLLEEETVVRVISGGAKGLTFKGEFAAARAALKANKTQEAVERFRHALMLKPKHATAWAELGFTLMKDQDYMAPEVLNYAIQLEAKPKRKAAGYYNLGRAHMFTKDYPAAVKAYERSLALRPDNKATMSALEEARVALKEAEAKAKQAKP